MKNKNLVSGCINCIILQISSNLSIDKFAPNGSLSDNINESR